MSRRAELYKRFVDRFHIGDRANTASDAELDAIEEANCKVKILIALAASGLWCILLKLNTVR